MRIIPAIDIIDGKCVRLTQGDYGKKKVYREDPVEVALEFQDADLDCLHLVDLDGARVGHVVNWEVIRDIQEKTALSVDFGGGVKTEAEVEQLLDLGVHQINIGSMAVKEPETFSKWLKKYGTENFVLSADVKNGNVAINGWLEDTKFRLFDLVSRFEAEGLEYLTCTDISTDGMLEGPNIGLYKKLINKFPKLKVVASGGVSNLHDLEELKYAKVYGVIIGKAIYEGKIRLEDLKAFQNS
ncbi:MAG: 1-(5-phosphoribosyl)-5-[(5-phosphoribosylamino)methylideneamino]imidazole-4-carboxamide isomerase [Cyclobacteriaceae bacterium]|nr:1-(5-phosphoribosyl)-5-[(5-phosphoribosylamino)methylideneamino]imidazole-4-carboxamide isomerase [Cyclobacteriaceae bacterium]MBX2916229.1 1-(5-phosphoribosyl)-5-[(5-phosphoribosylamino)methylideneamino]imidazole-4-carboxamide isomerase [Cyclobacteriaceae bacterium]